MELGWLSSVRDRKLRPLVVYFLLTVKEDFERERKRKINEESNSVVSDDCGKGGG